MGFLSEHHGREMRAWILRKLWEPEARGFKRAPAILVAKSPRLCRAGVRREWPAVRVTSNSVRSLCSHM